MDEIIEESEVWGANGLPNECPAKMRYGSAP
jgi:hypothetical protein